MTEWRPWQNILAGFLGGMVVAFGIAWLASQPRGTPILLDPIPTAAQIQVHVAGAVRTPGLYTLPPGSRTADAIEMAGGMNSEANFAAINLAEILRDGQQVYVSTAQEDTPVAISTARRGLLDINTATLEDLDNLPGIGPGRAQDIISYRAKIGGFKKLEELMDVPGIGQATFDELKPLVTIVP